MRRLIHHEREYIYAMGLIFGAILFGFAVWGAVMSFLIATSPDGLPLLLTFLKVGLPAFIVAELIVAGMLWQKPRSIQCY